MLNVDGFTAPWILDVMLGGIIFAIGLAEANKGLYNRLMPVLIAAISTVLSLIFTSVASPYCVSAFGDKMREKLLQDFTESSFDYSKLMKYVDEAPEQIIKFGLFCLSMIVFITVLTIIKNAFKIVIDLDCIAWIDHIGGFVLGVFLSVIVVLFLLYIAALNNVQFIPQLTQNTFLWRILVNIAYR